MVEWREWALALAVALPLAALWRVVLVPVLARYARPAVEAVRGMGASEFFIAVGDLGFRLVEYVLTTNPWVLAAIAAGMWGVALAMNRRASNSAADGPEAELDAELREIEREVDAVSKEIDGWATEEKAKGVRRRGKGRRRVPDA